ncbi:hypothetical protein EIP91_010846 [Steccherinum ochraceum]|uniref:Uncharacterized protein n=1 Tax=Steccherinum ochraceum TaxID=92696 RepID=A0A4R0R2P8_9APHY|nr:hypothetical protein EIP91_010846 [Steccherinum ochraceum]
MTSDLRSRELDEVLRRNYTNDDLWDAYGIVAGVKPFTEHFPRADIHKLMSPDILHQLIKGTFKDHLVAWVQAYVTKYNRPAKAKRIMDDIDRRIAAAPAFPGLRRFPQGRNFKQWTGNDSKALMKRMRDDLVEFNTHRLVFERLGIRPDGFSLPRQHSLVHYVDRIILFGSPNGLSSSITESKHISAVKEPWRASSKDNPLDQMIRNITRKTKIDAARIEFGRRGMLNHSVLREAEIHMGVHVLDDDEQQGIAAGWIGQEDGNGGAQGDDEDDAEGFEGDPEDDTTRDVVTLSAKYAFPRPVGAVAAAINQPTLDALCRRFLYDQLYPDAVAADDLPLDQCPALISNIPVYYSAAAVFYAPSDLIGPGGMQREMIRSNPSWRNEYGRYDTVLVQNNAEDEGYPMRGMWVARVPNFLAFSDEYTRYTCALVEWYKPCSEVPDPLTALKA